MKNSQNRRSWLPLLGMAAGALAAMVLGLSCATHGPATALVAETRAASTPEAGAAPLEALTAEEELFRSADLNPFAKENLGSFRDYRLSNGIPFLFKENRSQRVFALRIVIRGHTIFTPPDQAGIEALTLSMLTKGSASYSYEELQQLLYEKSSRMSPRSGSLDATSFGLTTFSKYLPDLFGPFTDSFLHPRWDPERFAEVLNDSKIARQRRENEPDGRSVALLEAHLFAGHPYEASPDGTERSLSRLTLADLVDYHRRMIVPNRLFVVAAGDFDAARLYQMLDATIGRLSGDPVEIPDPPPLLRAAASELITAPFADSEGLAYVRGAFALPPPDAPDYPAVLVALGMLDDLLYDSVRTRNGAAYGASVGLAGLKADYGTISIYKTSRPADVKAYIDEAVGVLASGRCLAARAESSAAGKGGIGASPEARETRGTYVPIAEALQFYKDQYLTGFYTGQATNSSIASQMAYSLIYHGDYRDYLLLTDRLSAVGPQEIVDAVRRYLLDEPILWVVVGAPTLLDAMNGADYRGIGGARRSP